MGADLRNQTLVAAAVAKKEGFQNTYKALIEIVRGLDQCDIAETSCSRNAPKKRISHEKVVSLGVT
jgi:hypothetical protein